MKKFSQISENEIIVDNTNTVSNDLTKLVESTLNVSITGDLDDFLTENISIDGKNLLVEKLVDYIESIKSNDNLQLLEKVRYQGIVEVEKELMINERNTPGEIKKHRFRIENLLDKKDPIVQAKRQADKIQSGEKAYYRGLAAEYMVEGRKKEKKILKEITSIFMFRSKQLGFKK